MQPSERYTALDTETSSLFDFSKPADAPGQPRLASMALQYLDSEMLLERKTLVLIKPDGWALDPKAAAVNGLTMERLNDEGIPVRDALEEYSGAVKSGRVIVAYNAQFDTKVMRGELRRAEMDDLFMVTRNICVMRPMTDVCQIPYASGRNGFKFPKLAEALAHIGAAHDGPHTADGDVAGAVEIMRWLAARQMLPAPGVHLAKKKPGEESAPVRKPRASAPVAVSPGDEIPA